MPIDWKIGHYAVGLRDGSSIWHLGTTIHRQCEQGCREAVEESERAVAARDQAISAAIEKLTPPRIASGDYVRGWQAALTSVRAVVDPPPGGWQCDYFLGGRRCGNRLKWPGYCYHHAALDRGD